MLAFTDQQKLLQQSARELAQTALKPLAAALDESERFPHEHLATFRTLGYLNFNYPEGLGGGGADFTGVCLVVQELARVCAATAITLVGHITGATAVLVGADAGRHRQLLLHADDTPRFLAIAISEPGAGSDVTAVSTRAVSAEGGYRLTGVKRFVTNGGEAEAYIIFARTGPHPHRGLSAFFVPAHTPGLIPGKKERKMGLRGSSTTDLVLEDAWIPAENLIGPEGEGFRVMSATMERTRVVVAAHALGIAEGAWEFARGYALERRQFGRRISDFQSMQFLLADLFTKVETARLAVYRAADLVGRGDEHAFLYSSMAKVVASDTAMEVATQAVQVLGGNGYMRDYPVERMMRDAKVTQIFEGTNQIQRQIIWKQIQGQLPR